MRLLFLTNLYPPLGNGGYEQWCQEVAEGLCSRGHDLVVLTTRRRDTHRIPTDPKWVHRHLFMEMEFASSDHALKFFTERRGRERANLDTLRRTLTEFAPEAVLVWGMWNLSRALPAIIEAQLPGRVIYYLGDYWPTLPNQHRFYWDAKAQSWATRLPKALLRPFAMRLMEREPDPVLQFQHGLFPSAFMQEEYTRRGIFFQKSQVILGAVDTRPFMQVQAAQNSSSAGEYEPFKLLYVGRLSPEKGVPVVIQAVEELVLRRGMQVHLTIVGSGERGYVAALRQQVQAIGLEQAIEFSSPVAKEEIPALYRRFDAVVFPSTWQEPFGRVLVEALASGVAVIATATGGAAEIVQAEENALTFAPGDSGGLASQVARLANETGLRRRLIEQGQLDAVEKFDSSRMVSEIESYIQALICD